MQAKHEHRLLFLKQFTKELILKSKPPEYKIEKEKLEETHYGEFIPSIPISEETKPEFLKQVSKGTEKKLIMPSQISTLRHKVKLVRPISQVRFIKPIRSGIRTEIQPIQPQPSPEAIDLGKLNIFIRDSRVTVIECPGPGKFILAKTMGQVTVTKTSLTKEEIQNIINKFSEKSKIPVISGLFKAAVGNLIITAVISDLVGSRFIITKMTPRFIMEQTVAQ